MKRNVLRENVLGPPRLLFTLRIQFENGDEMEIVSDQTWRGREGSLRHDSVFNGEFYDGRNDRPNWDQAGFTDSLTLWIQPDVLSSPLNSSLNSSLVLQDMLPIRAGPEALHFDVSINSEQQGYLNAKDIGQIKGGNLSDGGILKPVATWISGSSMYFFLIDSMNTFQFRILHRYPNV